MKLLVILGTRPEIIKMSPVIRELVKQGLDYSILHTGQHYSYEMDKVFFKELDLPQPKYNLNVGSGSPAEQTGRMLIGIEEVLLEEKPNIIMVEGDTNTVLAGALAAKKVHIKVGHVEAGERSYDMEMPEEINRILTDHISDYLFASTETKKDNLLQEGIPQNRIFVTGNTLVDAVYQNLKNAERRTEILANLGLKGGEYFLVTVHRQENVTAKERLESILEGLGLVYEHFHLPLIFPIHPRTRKRIQELRLNIPQGVKSIEPLGFFDFLALEKSAALILTDSGGVKMEAYILHVPCVTLRNTTELPETVEAGCNILAGYEANNILRCVDLMMERNNNWDNLFGDGKAAPRIIEIIKGSLT